MTDLEFFIRIVNAFLCFTTIGLMVWRVRRYRQLPVAYRFVWQSMFVMLLAGGVGSVEAVLHNVSGGIRIYLVTLAAVWAFHAFVRLALDDRKK